MKFVLIGFVLLVIYTWVNNAMKSPEEKELERYQAAANRAQLFHNTNRSIAADSVCDAAQQIRNPEMCEELANEKTEELNKRSEAYWK